MIKSFANQPSGSRVENEWITFNIPELSPEAPATSIEGVLVVTRALLATCCEWVESTSHFDKFSSRQGVGAEWEAVRRGFSNGVNVNCTRLKLCQPYSGALA
jgi:hypothetical protein